MSVTSPFLRLIARTAIAAAALCWATGAQAQASPPVNDADIARAARGQPVITDSDIERARQKYRMPSETELGRAPVPAAPKLDALPAPASAAAIDLEALARGYADQADNIAATQQLRSGPGLMIFVSFSMPAPTLQRLVDQAARAQASLLVRGFVNGSLRETVARVQALIGQRQVAFQIDPQAFERFAVLKTPTFVLVRDSAQAQPCGTGLCLPADSFVAAAGDVSLDYALEFMLRRAPPFAPDARRYLNRIRG